MHDFQLGRGSRLARVGRGAFFGTALERAGVRLPFAAAVFAKFGGDPWAQ